MNTLSSRPMSPGKNSAGQTETVLISSGPKSTATITVRSDGHTDVFSVPQSPLLKRQAGPTSTK